MVGARSAGIVLSALWISLLAGCGGSVTLKDPTEPFREIGGGIKRSFSGGMELDSIGVIAPVTEIRGVDGSFVLTRSPVAAIPFYTNGKGPVSLMWLKNDYTGTKQVRVSLEGEAEPLYGRLAIYPAFNVKESDKEPERFNHRIFVSQAALEQMEKEGVGRSCDSYKLVMHNMCDWVLWISRKPIEE
ncbi:MAG: hypothetical protein OEW15_17665 [Nitrospirota bacterium]|nr:hypothetical protein [Nitrospirota bacterium]